MECVQLHGLVPAGTHPHTASPPHEVVPCGPVSALISYTSRLTTPDELPPEEVASWALNHNAILTAYCDKTTVVPMALGAVFSSKAAVVSELRAHMDANEKTLRALKDVQEFTVQLKIVSTPKVAPNRPNSGREFLQLQRARRDGRDSLHQDRHVFAQKVLNQLQTPALQIEASTSSKPDRLINYAVLVQKSDVVHLHQMARELHTPAQMLGLDLIITGPWPPYSSHVLKVTETREACDVIGT